MWLPLLNWFVVMMRNQAFAGTGGGWSPVGGKRTRDRLERTRKSSLLGRPPGNRVPRDDRGLPTGPETSASGPVRGQPSAAGGPRRHGAAGRSRLGRDLAAVGLEDLVGRRDLLLGRLLVVP